MSSLPPSLSVTLSAEKRSCVLDASLALSRYGLLLAKRLGDEFNLWLVRELWHILDNTHTFRMHPELLVPGTGSPGEHIDLDGLSQWEKVRYEKDLAGLKVCWLSDQIGDSLLPSGIDPDIFSRYEVLAASLEARKSRDKSNGNNEENVLAACFRDAAALSVALTQYKSFILSLTRPRGKKPKAPSFADEPFLCAALKKWGIKSQPVCVAKQAQLEWEFIAPILSRTGISELMWAGMNPVAVHIFAPRASIMPTSINGDNEDVRSINDLALPSIEKEVATADWWKDAICFWYPLWTP